jgi:peroxiredoxin
MKKLVLSLFAVCSVGAVAHADAVVGQPAPAFAVKDATGKDESLAEYKGKWVVLEWYNKDCPFVKKHYGSNNMQTLQDTYTKKGVTWLSVLSSAKGKEGYIEPAVAVANAKEKHSHATALLMDSSGTIGKAYGAKTTPHMFVINPQGTVVYAGAIDSNDSADPAVIANSKNYVAAALDEGMAGKKIDQPTSRPYGCGVKY